MTEEKKIIDDCFYIEEKRWGTWQSHYLDGIGIVTSLTEEECIRSTRFYLKNKQEDVIDQNQKTYSSTVEGKL
jgi:hypothetical protein